jgi:2-keto-4-pentenoate hydratase
MDPAAALADWLQAQLAGSRTPVDVLQEAPGLSLTDAYRVQHALIERHVARGDRVVGYKAAFTSEGMQQKFGLAEPLLGTLLGSRSFDESAPTPVAGYVEAILEPEIAIQLSMDLPGPGVSRRDALAAVGGYLPCVEVADLRAPRVFSPQHAVAFNTFNGGNVFGASLAPPCDIDLPAEQVVLRVNGEARGTASAAAVLGDPINAVAFMANKAAELGWPMKSGMVLMTGGIVPSVTVAPGDEIQVDFTRLGRLRFRLPR